jgi:alanine racemase
MDHHDIGDPSESFKSNMFRLGISMYGYAQARSPIVASLTVTFPRYYPSDEMSNRNDVHLKPVMTWKTKIIQSKDLTPGHKISYGGYYETSRHPHTSIATLPVGYDGQSRPASCVLSMSYFFLKFNILSRYADGYRRLLGAARNHKTGKVENHGWGVLLRGHKANIVGRVCMDMFMIDVTDIASHHGGEVREGEEIVLMGQQGRSQIACDEMAHALGTITYEVTCLVGKRVPRVYLRGGDPISAKSLLGEFKIMK